MANSRIESIDLYRGFLVVSMIIAHMYLHVARATLADIVIYFIPTGFILVSGFVHGRSYRRRLSSQRSLLRGLKLLFLYLILNVAVSIITRQSFDILNTLFVINPETVSFEILLPIALTMICSAIYKPNNIVFVVCLLVAIITFDIIGFIPYVPKFFLVGYAGFTLGIQTTLERFLIISTKNSLRIFAISFLLSAALLLTMHLTRLPWSLQIPLSISLYYVSIVAVHYIRILKPILLVMGKYSLLLYIVHIGIIKAFSLLFDVSGLIPFVLSTCLLIPLLYVTVRILDVYRRNNSTINTIYNVMFA